jgi:putative GTP pyrophosphokinase
MNIYEKAGNQVLDVLKGIQLEYKTRFNCNIVNYFETRIKEPKSITNKMKKKNLELNYKNMIEGINDISGVRAVCNTKEDIYNLVSIIEKVPNWNLIRLKDYIKTPKKSEDKFQIPIKNIYSNLFEELNAFNINKKF